MLFPSSFFCLLADEKGQNPCFISISSSFCDCQNDYYLGKIDYLHKLFDKNHSFFDKDNCQIENDVLQ